MIYTLYPGYYPLLGLTPVQKKNILGLGVAWYIVILVMLMVSARLAMTDAKHKTLKITCDQMSHKEVR